MPPNKGKTVRVRKDKKKSQTKVAGALLKDPLASERQIAKATGLGNGTVHRAKDELERIGAIAKDDDIITIMEKDKEHLVLIQDLQDTQLKRYKTELNENTRKFSTRELNDLEHISDSKQKRMSILGGENTDKGGAENKKIFFLPEND